MLPLLRPSLLPSSPPSSSSSSVSPLDWRQDGHRKSGTGDSDMLLFFCIHILHLARGVRSPGCVTNGRFRVYIRRSMEGLCGAGRITDRLTRCVCVCVRARGPSVCPSCTKINRKLLDGDDGKHTNAFVKSIGLIIYSLLFFL